jgi:hypothetical protein
MLRVALRALREDRPGGPYARPWSGHRVRQLRRTTIKPMLSLSDQAVTGWFTLAAGFGGAAVVGFFGRLGRKS